MRANQGRGRGAGCDICEENVDGGCVDGCGGEGSEVFVVSLRGSKVSNESGDCRESDGFKYLADPSVDGGMVHCAVAKVKDGFGPSPKREKYHLLQSRQERLHDHGPAQRL
jgi:hypothetical protein